MKYLSQILYSSLVSQPCSVGQTHYLKLNVITLIFTTDTLLVFLNLDPPGALQRGSLLHTLVLRVCLVHFVKSCKDVNMAFEVLNEVYLQKNLYRWVVNREMNLMMLINL